MLKKISDIPSRQGQGIATDLCVHILSELKKTNENLEKLTNQIEEVKRNQLIARVALAVSASIIGVLVAIFTWSVDHIPFISNVLSASAQNEMDK